MALCPLLGDLAVLDYRFNGIGQFGQHDLGDLVLGVEGLALALLVHQRLIPREVLENADPADCKAVPVDAGWEPATARRAWYSLVSVPEEAG